MDSHGSSDGSRLARRSRSKRPRHRYGSWGAGGGAALACRAFEVGATFIPAEIREVASAAIEARGSEKCDVVYHVDGQRYQLGGCNREYLGEWSKRDGVPSDTDMDD